MNLVRKAGFSEIGIFFPLQMPLLVGVQFKALLAEQVSVLSNKEKVL